VKRGIVVLVRGGAFVATREIGGVDAELGPDFAWDDGVPQAVETSTAAAMNDPVRSRRGTLGA
jgi:hypothetical protein